jgi:hypothetical protein
MMRPFVLVLVLGVAIGCGSGDSGPAVEGVITLDGQPLANANIQLIPQGSNMGQTGFGRTDASGKFEISSADGKQQGTAPGDYKVVISKLVNPDGTDFVARADEDPGLANYKELLPPLYSNPEQTKLTAKIPAEGKKDLNFKLTKSGRGS